jgi:hypothetical protein
MIRLASNFLLFYFLLFISCEKLSDKDFFAAVREKRYLDVKQYFEKGYKITDMVESPLIIALNNDDIEMIMLLLNNGSDPNLVYQNETLLQRAIKLKNIALIKLLLERGVDINYVDANGKTAFWRAISFLPDEDLGIFIEYGLNPLVRTKQNGKNVSYFEELIMENKIKTAKLFLENKTVVDDIKNNPNTIFILLQNWNSDVREIMDFLVAKGFELNDELPLLQSVTASYDATLWLLDHGVSPVKEYTDPDAADFLKTPLDTAYFGLYMVTTWAQMDGGYVENSPDELERRRVIELLETVVSTYSKDEKKN